MNRRYQPIEKIFKLNSKYTALTLSNDSAILRIFRIISGSVDIKDIYTGKTHRLRNNYIKFPASLNVKATSKVMLSCFPPEITINDLNNYFQKSRRNITFYKSIEAELIKCILSNQNNKYLESFFYLYRIIEGISYAIPLIYVSKKNDYNKTYHELQSYFGKDRDGELAFFKRFVIEVYKDEDFFKSSVDINILDIDDEDLRKEYYTLYLEKIKGKGITSKVEFETISIKFIAFYDFLIELRNRFFHNAKGTWQDNLESTKLLYPDLFFKPLINHGINWVSIILFEVIKTDFSAIR